MCFQEASCISTVFEPRFDAALTQVVEHAMRVITEQANFLVFSSGERPSIPNDALPCISFCFFIVLKSALPNSRHAVNRDLGLDVELITACRFCRLDVAKTFLSPFVEP